METVFAESHCWLPSAIPVEILLVDMKALASVSAISENRDYLDILLYNLFISESAQAARSKRAGVVHAFRVRSRIVFVIF